MESVEEFELCNAGTNKKSTCIRAGIKDNCLKIRGEDSGSDVGVFYSAEILDFSFSFDEENTEKFIRLLSNNNQDAKTALLEHFGGFDFIDKMCALCKENNIEYKSEQSVWRS
ncbi:hypothetical protein MmiAt1_08340 [Methanimicrococcus sp. At1]|uniref:Uncharacterized protein n=1 Tax=Methanimicrococcus hacksteinii TaxID=3028293 RepID=A0ABU3VQ34_9EURY|nr:hypothetical protein [Methanimicrococcus sp. At1]MDV0445266.1 hypothetical protein [Methanimicrococcus sp. At1]